MPEHDAFAALRAENARLVALLESHGIEWRPLPAGWLERRHLLDERRQAREDQKRVEQHRLMAHQRLAIELLARPARKIRLMKAARAEVKRWAKQNLCSQDYIDRWTEWLSLPEADLVERMCSDADGWGNAMRQNSPFTASFR